MATQGQGAGQYKRSWKNLLINKRYQLRFTLFMVGLSTLLMIGLGFWVMDVANEATNVSKAGAVESCLPSPKLLEVDAPIPPPPADEPTDEPADEPIDEPAGSAAPAEAPKDDPAKPAKPAKDDKSADKADGSAADETEEERPRAKIQLDDSKIDIVAPPPKILKVPPDMGNQIVERWRCEFANLNRIAELEARRRQILFVLIGTGIFLAFGLGIYGIKMTHKVAGPLFKVGLYLAKMRDGRYDKVYNLRKGDQLVNFYEHFKLAHSGVVQMEKDDIARLKSVIAAAEAAGAGEDAIVGELRDLVARKEKSVE